MGAYRRGMKRVLPLAALAAVGMALTACSGSPVVSGTSRSGATPGHPTVSASGTSPTTSGSTSTTSATTSAATRSSAAPSSTPTASARPTAAPAHFTRTTLYRGAAHPDDLAFDLSGRLLFSDYTNGTVGRLNADGTVTVVHRGLSGAEGLVQLANGTLVVAEEKTNQIVSFPPGSSAPHLLRTMPGQPTLVECHQGVDGIAWDPTTKSLVVPDSPTGTIYRLSTDGRQLTRIGSGFTHPVGAAVGADGTVYVADECGGDVWKLSAGGARVEVASASMPDDVALDGAGDIVVTDVRRTRHSVTRTDLATGATTTLASAGLVEPQGLVIDGGGALYVSDDIADVIIKLTPRP